MPNTIPGHHREMLAVFLGIADVSMADDPHDPTIHTIHHQGADWTAKYQGAYEGEPIWNLTGPTHPDGILLDRYGITDAITRP